MFLGGFILRLIVLGRLTASPFLLPAQGDMRFYDEWAQRILHGQFTDHLAFYGLPLYAYLLAGFYTVFGHSPFFPGLAQAALEGGTCTVIFLLGRRVFDGPEPLPSLSKGAAIGLIAAAGWAFFVPAQTYSVILMPTAWLIFVFWFLVWKVVQFGERRPTLPACLAFGVLIGVTAMGIATILFLIPLILAGLFLRKNFRRDFAHCCAAAALLFLGVGLGTSPAWLHNRLVAHDPVFLSAHSGVNFWIGNNPDANGYPRFPPGLRAGQRAMLADSITAAESAAGRALKRSEVSDFWLAKAKAYIAQNPGAWLRLLLVKIANFWSAFQYDDLSIVTSLRESGVTFPGPGFGLIAAFALPGMLIAVFAIPASRWILAAVLLHMLSLLSVFVTERYRLAVVPGLLLFAAFGLWALWRNCATGRYRRAPLYSVLLLTAVWLVTLRRGNAELWALDPYNSGLQALAAGRLDVAERKLERAHAYVPTNAEVDLALGNLWHARGEKIKARRFYLDALALQPRHKSALINLGVLALEDRQWIAARRLFERALAIAPNDAKTHYLRARACLALNDTACAESEIGAALRLQPVQKEFIEFRDQIRTQR
ncbi:MAG: tetratricopeptide repeat protein [Chthoniobacterales bacterium]